MVRQPRNYIVRIYRQGARDLAGIVEDARSGRQCAFSSVQELWKLLRRPLPRSITSRARNKKT
jgi:hypothetical protein